MFGNRIGFARPCGRGNRVDRPWRRVVRFSSTIAFFACALCASPGPAEAQVFLHYSNTNGDSSFTIGFSGGSWESYGCGVGGGIVYPLGQASFSYYPYGPTRPVPPSSMPYYLRRVYTGSDILPFSWDRYGLLVDAPVKQFPSQRKVEDLCCKHEMDRGKGRLSKGDCKGATESFRAAVLCSPREPRPKALLGLALLGCAEFTLAAKAVRRAIADSTDPASLIFDRRELFPDDAACADLQSSARSWAEAHRDASSGLLLAYLLAVGERTEEAILAAELTAKDFPADPEVGKLLETLKTRKTGRSEPRPTQPKEE
ncbi:MAG: hypothetical protein RDV41_04420 [Planctomycetota bacterium]|nr:hypothetical protein [Planctomycetota bacterium]